MTNIYTFCFIYIDVVSYELLDLAPVPYETFMKTFGAGNTFQTASQTGDSLNEETQTEAIEMKDKQIQYPPSISSVVSSATGLDNDSLGDDTKTSLGASSGSMRLSMFLKRASHTMITLVEEDSQNNQDEHKSKKEEKQKENLLPFSERVITLDSNVYKFLKGRPVTKIEFAPYQPDVFVSCHGYPDSKEKRKKHSQVDDNCFVCLWNVNYPTIVQKGIESCLWNL